MWKGKKRQRTEIWWFYNLIRTLMDNFTAWSLNQLRIKLNFLHCRLFTFWYNSCLLSHLVTCYHILGDRCASTSISPIKSGAFSFTRKQKKIPAALKEVNRLNLCQMCDVIFHLWHWIHFLHVYQVSANTENSSMSGYLNRSKGNKKQWKRLWFVIKNKVLYTYAASEVL